MATAITATSGSKKVVVRKRRKRKKKGKNYYFHQGTEKAIIRYNKSDNAHLKNKIYNEHIRAAFDKLAEKNCNIFSSVLSTSLLGRYSNFFSKINSKSDFFILGCPNR